MPKYQVIIPYHHRFIVTADNEDDAIDKAHDAEGVIIGYDDNDAIVDKLDNDGNIIEYCW